MQGETFTKRSPAHGRAILEGARSRAADVDAAVAAARASQEAWADTPPIRRGEIIREITLALARDKERIARIVALETGKSVKDALGETQGAIELGFLMAAEARRFHGRVATSAVPHRQAMTLRHPVGIAGLIIAANTPIANVAWKVFPAILCGNATILKASEDSPATAWAFGRLAKEAGLPDGVLNIVHGLGREAGAPIVEHPGVDMISFTGSCEVGREIHRVAGERLARVCLELGGKNPLVVCDDADLELAAKWASLSAFSNAGQRCAAGSRIIVFDAVYDAFRELLLERVKRLRVGPSDEDDLGPVINEDQLDGMLSAIARARDDGARILSGGHRLADGAHAGGYYLAPTLIEGAKPSEGISREELFGPITCLYRVRGFDEALALANDSPFGLTASIHTASLHRANRFIEKAQAGMVVVNGGTYGNEPHMPFGGLKASGNGWREPGPESLDMYSEWKTVYVVSDPGKVG